VALWGWLAVIVAGGAVLFLALMLLVAVIGLRRLEMNMPQARKSLLAAAFDGLCDDLSRLILGRWSDI